MDHELEVAEKLTFERSGSPSVQTMDKMINDALGNGYISHLLDPIPLINNEPFINALHALTHGNPISVRMLGFGLQKIFQTNMLLLRAELELNWFRVLLYRRMPGEEFCDIWKLLIPIHNQPEAMRANAVIAAHLLSKAGLDLRQIPVVKGDEKMDALPVGVGDAELQKSFISTHESFLREFPEIRALADKAFTLTLEKYNAELPTSMKEDEGTSIRLAQIIVFYLSRTAFDAFGDLLILAGNGRGFAARMMLRVMYEHLVTAAFISQNPSEARRFDESAGLQKGKIWNRTVELVPQVKGTMTPEQIQKVEESFENAKAQLKAETCKKCNQPITQEAWTRASVEEMAQKADAATGSRLANLYTTCFLVPTFFIHPTAFGLESRSGRVEDGVVFRDISEHEAHDATMRGHGLVLRLLKLLNSYFNLGLDTQLDARWSAFPQIWNGALPDPPTVPDQGATNGDKR